MELATGFSMGRRVSDRPSPAGVFRQETKMTINGRAANAALLLLCVLIAPWSANAQSADPDPDPQQPQASALVGPHHLHVAAGRAQPVRR